MLLGVLLMMGSSSGVFMVTGLVMALASAAAGVVGTLVNLHYQKKKEQEKETRRREAYNAYLEKKTEEIREKYTHNQQALAQMYPSADTCLGWNEKSAMLWNRNPGHGDFLCVRLGEGDTDFQVKIRIPKEKFRLEEDELAEKPRAILENYQTLRRVPILLDLREHTLVGVAGGQGKAGAIEIARVIACQLAACTCYTDVKMIFVYDESNSEDSGQWGFARWLPHVWAEDKKVRYIASSKLEAGEIFYEITRVLRAREENLSGKEKSLPRPWFVMFLSDPALIQEELIARYVFGDAGEVGLTTIMLSGSSQRLPNACEYIVENDSVFQGVYNVSAQKQERTRVKFDRADPGKLDRFSRTLSNIQVQEMETGGEVPSSLTFFDMYGVTNPGQLKAEERWLKNRTYDSIRALIGQKAGGVPLYMDIHEKYHGPHGLVAGTTGSGKSELLQTYILSLAVNYSPDDIGFFIIDYKGGGMAHLFDGLPHLIGQISNLSGNQVYRAMVSIKSENRRRQRIFTEHGVNNINSYTRLYKAKEASDPLPHLFIIIDEFAELKREEPDFMKELISVAQVGRSLGVHLILATQKPAGTVDDNIWSNSRFRLCLRVQDRQDSNDMIHKPDAAYITQAGRCYLQVGNDEVYELFQSGWSGAPCGENLEDGRSELAELLSVNGKAAMTGGHDRARKKQQALHRWVQGLVRCLEETDISGRSLPEAAELFYQRLAANGVDYQKNRYNLTRLEDFIRLYQEAIKTEGDISEEIIRLSGTLDKKLPRPRERTQLDAVKEYLQKTAAENGYRQSHRLWLPVLPDHIYLADIPGFKNEALGEAWSLETPVGMADDPWNQAQMPLVLSFSEGGSHAVIGSVVSGKSTLIQTVLFGLVSRYSPDWLNIYALDFSSRMMSAFEGLPHFGGIMYEGDDEKIARFFNMILRILDERKKLFRGGNYSQYVQVHGVTCPAILIVIDNFSAFREKTGDAYGDLVIQISREGVGHGIFLLVSGQGFGMNEIPGRVAENLKTVLCLEMADKYAYADVLHTTRIQVLPESGIRGRGLAMVGGRVLEYQSALAVEAEDDYQRMEKISQICRQMNRTWKGRKARPVPEIPEKPTWELFTGLEQVAADAGTDYLLPVGYDAETAEVYSIDLSSVYCYLITGAAGTGKKNFLRIMMASAMLKKSHVCLIDGGGLLGSCADLEGITYVSNGDELFSYFMNTLTPEFQRRNRMKAEILASGGEEEELFSRTRKEMPMFLFITDMVWFVNTVYSAENTARGMDGFMETLTSKGRLHNIYFVGILNLEDRNAVRGTRTFLNFTSYRTGIHFGGNMSQDVFLNFSYLSFKEMNRPEKPGIGQLSPGGREGETRKVVVPLMSRKKRMK